MYKAAARRDCDASTEFNFDIIGQSYEANFFADRHPLKFLCTPLLSRDPTKAARIEVSLHKHTQRERKRERESERERERESTITFFFDFNKTFNVVGSYPCLMVHIYSNCYCPMKKTIIPYLIIIHSFFLLSVFSDILYPCIHALTNYYVL